MGPWPWPFIGNLAVLLAVSCTVAALVTWVGARRFHVAIDPVGSRKLYPLTASATFVVLFAFSFAIGFEPISVPIANAPACGVGCYRADWSKGLARWGATREWHVANGLLMRALRNSFDLAMLGEVPSK